MSFVSASNSTRVLGAAKTQFASSCWLLLLLINLEIQKTLGLLVRGQPDSIRLCCVLLERLFRLNLRNWGGRQVCRRHWILQQDCMKAGRARATTITIERVGLRRLIRLGKSEYQTIKQPGIVFEAKHQMGAQRLKSPKNDSLQGECELHM